MVCDPTARILGERRIGEGQDVVPSKKREQLEGAGERTDIFQASSVQSTTENDPSLRRQLSNRPSRTPSSDQHHRFQ